MRSVSHLGTHLNITLNNADSTKSQIIFEYWSKLFYDRYSTLCYQLILLFVLGRLKYLYLVYQSFEVFVFKRSIYFSILLNRSFRQKLSGYKHKFYYAIKIKCYWYDCKQ